MSFHTASFNNLMYNSALLAQGVPSSRAWSVVPMSWQNIRRSLWVCSFDMSQTIESGAPTSLANCFTASSSSSSGPHIKIPCQSRTADNTCFLGKICHLCSLQRKYPYRSNCCRARGRTRRHPGTPPGTPGIPPGTHSCGRFLAPFGLN